MFILKIYLQCIEEFSNKGQSKEDIKCVEQFQCFFFGSIKGFKFVFLEEYYSLFVVKDGFYFIEL